MDPNLSLVGGTSIAAAAVWGCTPSPLLLSLNKAYSLAVLVLKITLAALYQYLGMENMWQLVALVWRSRLRITPLRQELSMFMISPVTKLLEMLFMAQVQTMPQVSVWILWRLEVYLMLLLLQFFSEKTRILIGVKLTFTNCLSTVLHGQK